jgi:hypothetical protein
MLNLRPAAFPILRSSCCIMRVMARPKPPKLTGRFYFPTTPTTQEISDLALAVQTWIVGRVARDTAPRVDFPPTAQEQRMVELLTKLGELRRRMEAPRRLSHGSHLDAVIQLRSKARIT